MRRTGIIAIALCMIALSGCKKSSVGTTKYPFQNPELSVEERVEDIISRLTLEEKVAQMMNSTPSIDSLGIPRYDWWNEALHGVARAGKATVFPQSIAMAATFDEEAILRTFTIVSDEARAKYHEFQRKKEYQRYKGLTFWTPNINIFRDPRWGRGMETYGEDPYLTSRLGLAVVKGLQGDDPKYLKSHACAKHYAVHSGPEWNRHSYNAIVSPRDLWQTYLPAFETLVKEGNVQEVMCAYNRFEGQPCCGNNKLLVDILRKQWGYDNIIVSDCGAIGDFYGGGRHGTHANAAEASVDAVRNGTDVECGGAYSSLVEAVKKGQIKEEELNVSLRRLFRGRMELGMFDPDELVPYSSIPYSIVENEEHVNYSLEMARKCMVLLKNGTTGGKPTLPLSKDIKKIAVVGPNAVDSTMLWANYNGTPTHTVTILEGIREKASNAEVTYIQGCNLTDNKLFFDLMGSLSSEGKTGMSVEFYNNTKFDGAPAYKGITTQFQYNTGGNTQFAPGVSLTDFTGLFTGDFTSPITGEISIKVSVDDGFRLKFGAEQIADLWTYDKARGNKEYKVKVVKGKKYPVKLEYLQEKGGANLSFNIGYYDDMSYTETASKVKNADVIVFVGGLSPRLEGEEMSVSIDGFKRGDRTKIELPKAQTDLLKSLKSTGKPLVFVICTGSALALTEENKTADAILNAWYGGQQAGTAVADILFGDCNPSGKLPITFYKSTAQLPDFEDYNMKGRTYRYMTEEPLFPFGYGLSYTTFTFGDASLSTNEFQDGKTVDITIPVKNTGSVDGEEVVQVYVRNPNDAAGPLKALRGFRRVRLKAGEEAKATVTLERDAFLSFNDETQAFELRKGKYDILYGSSSSDSDLKSVEVTVK